MSEEEWGRDAIHEAHGVDTLYFPDSYLDELRITRDIGVNNGFLKIYSKISDDSVSVWNHFSSSGARVERLVTKDKTVDLRGGLDLEGTTGSDSIQGTRRKDEMLGLAGEDTLRGDHGRDVLEGGAERDHLDGGPGNDTYVFRPGFGHDVVSEEGGSPFEADSGGDMIAMYGIDPGSVEIETDFQGRQTIRVLDALGNTTDSIFIPSQSFNYGTDLLVEWIQFDDGARMPLIDTV